MVASCAEENWRFALSEKMEVPELGDTIPSRNPLANAFRRPSPSVQPTPQTIGCTHAHDQMDPHPGDRQRTPFFACEVGRVCEALCQ